VTAPNTYFHAQVLSHVTPATATLAMNMSACALPFVPLLTRIVLDKTLLVNEYVLAENKIVRSKLGTRKPLTDKERHRLARDGMPIRPLPRQVMTVARPETLPAWNREMKKAKDR
jgi:hypothetical protein